MNVLQVTLRSTALTLGLAGMSAQAIGDVETDLRCLSSATTPAIRLEWHTFADSAAGWFGGYVRYEGKSQVIPIVLSDTQTLSRPSGRPWEFRYVWLEVSNGRITGEYHLSSQGADVYDFSYKNLRTGKLSSFPEVKSAVQGGECKWQ